MELNTEKAFRWHEVAKNEYPLTADVIHVNSSSVVYAGSGNSLHTVLEMQRGSTTQMRFRLPPMCIASAPIVQRSVFSNYPTTALTEWGFHRDDTKTGLIDKTRPAIRSFHVIGMALKEYEGHCFKKEWEDALAFLKRAQNTWWDWVINESKAVEIMRHIGPHANPRVKIIEGYVAAKELQGPEYSFSRHCNDNTRYTNIIQRAGDDEEAPHVFRLDKPIQKWLDLSSQGKCAKSSILNDAFTKVNTKHKYDPVRVAFNGLDNKRIELDAANTQDWTRIPDWIASGAVFQPTVHIKGSVWSNNANISLVVDDLLFWPVPRVSTSAHGGPSGACAERCCSHARRLPIPLQPSSVMLPTPK